MYHGGYGTCISRFKGRCFPIIKGGKKRNICKKPFCITDEMCHSDYKRCHFSLLPVPYPNLRARRGIPSSSGDSRQIISYRVQNVEFFRMILCKAASSFVIGIKKLRHIASCLFCRPGQPFPIEAALQLQMAVYNRADYFSIPQRLQSVQPLSPHSFFISSFPFLDSRLIFT